jgi:hypothetical protein
MENQELILSSNESWDKVKLVAKHPMVVIPSVVGLLFLIIALFCTGWVQTLFVAISSIGLGVAINYYSFYFKDLSTLNQLTTKIKDMNAERGIFMEKSKSAVISLKNISNEILYKANEEKRALTYFEKGLISKIATIQSSFDVYFTASFQSEIHQFVNESERLTDADNAEDLIKLENTLTFLTAHGYQMPTGSFDLNDATRRVYSRNNTYIQPNQPNNIQNTPIAGSNNPS